MWSYKNRIINTQKTVDIYRNLHEECWSLRQGNLVVAHATKIILKDCEYIVKEKARQRIVKNKRKEVCAFIRGYLSSPEEVRQEEEIHSLGPDECFDCCTVYFNPYYTETFQDFKSGISVTKSDFCDLDVNSKDPVIAIWKQYIPQEKAPNYES